MKNKWTLLCLATVTLFASLTNADTAVLLMGKVHKPEGTNATIAGATRAIIKARDAQTTVTADEIAFDSSANILSCRGASVVSSGERTIKGNDLRIELGGNPVSIFILNPEGVLSLGAKRDFDSWKPGAQTPPFVEQLPGVDFNLKTPTKAPAPTPAAVTPPAAPEPRQP